MVEDPEYFRASQHKYNSITYIMQERMENLINRFEQISNLFAQHQVTDRHLTIN